MVRPVMDFVSSRLVPIGRWELQVRSGIWLPSRDVFSDSEGRGMSASSVASGLLTAASGSTRAPGALNLYRINLISPEQPV